MQPPDLGPRYEYLRDLGRGGMGRVVLVRDAHLGTELALKLLEAPLENAEAVEQFQKEFALLTGIEHPGIARAYDFGYAGGRPFFTSELVAGETLAKREPPPAAEELLSLARDIADALAFLHRSGILHLDLKPSNVMLPPRGQRPVLIDFGLFRRGFSKPPGRGVQGSVPYMAPECFRGGALGPWTDVYAFGATIYRVATGRFPRAVAETEAGDWDPAPRPPSSFAASFPSDLDPIVLKCLALDPHARFQDGGELLRALDAAAGRRVAACEPAPSAPRTIGREAELDAASRFLEGLRSREGPPVLLVTGPPGIGQTRFLREVKVRAQLEGFRFYLETGYTGRRGPPGSIFRPLSAHVDAHARARWEAFLSRLRKPRRSPRGETSEEELRLRWAGEVALAAEAVRDPVILAADGLERLDEVSVTLLSSLARLLGASPSSERPPIGIVAGYREEGSSMRWLRDLTEQLMQPGIARVVPLKPLGPAESIELYRLKGGRESEATRGLGLYQETQGLPGRIAALAASSSGSAPHGAPGTSEPIAPAAASDERGVITLDARSREVAWTLMLLGRPATATELSMLTGVSRGGLGPALERLKRSGLAVEEDEGAAQAGWLAGSRAAKIAPLSRTERTRMHRRIASRLCRSVSGPDDPHLAEAVHHFQAAGSRAMLLKHGRPLARYLKATLQSRAALELYKRLLDALPRGHKGRLELTLDLAELQARVGDLDDGIRILGEILSAPVKASEPWRTRVLLRLASLHSRRGDFRRADSLFREGLRTADRHAAPLPREEVLHFINEHAAMKAFAGEHEKAKSLCAEGLKIAGRWRSKRVREAVLNLHATQGSVALREFRFDEASRELETALEIAETAGSLASKAVILNNLGIVRSQNDQPREAIRAFEEAVRTCLRIDEGPSLTFIHGNLAVLHAKTGDWDAMEKALAELRRVASAAASRRQELFLHHHAGLALLYNGRFAAARRNLESAIRLGAAIGDRLLTAFDRVYRAECLVFEGLYAEAGRDLQKSAASEASVRIRAMALARIAFLEALTSGTDAAGVEGLAAKRESLLREERRVPFLDAWDSIYIGWALSISRAHARAIEVVAPAVRYFRQNGLRPAAALAAWVLAEASLLSGDTQNAMEMLETEESSPSSLLAVLRPLLLARVHLEADAKRENSAARFAKAADLLADAGAALVGNPMPEWTLRLEAMRARIREPANDAHEPSSIERRRKELARELPDAARRAYAKSRHWRAWTDFTLGASRKAAVRREPTQLSSPVRREEPTGTKTVSLRGEAASGSRADVVALSPGMRAVTAALDRLRETELPVVISGETGAGKDLIARIIHAESRRFAGPFLVLDCATVPAALLDVELFGARAGAFTDLKTDRDGILMGASGGTVLVDEVAGASLEAQAKLLRVISERSIRPVGAETEIPIDVRFLFSTSRDLAREARDGRFRQDLLHRIQVLVVRIPALRERPEDLPGLVEVFLRDGAGSPPTLGRDVIERLREQPWPGNVRELRNLLARLRIEEPREITLESLAAAGACEPSAGAFARNLLSTDSLDALKEKLERDYIEHHLMRLSGDAAATSRFLGVSRKHFYRRCRKLGVRLRGNRRTKERE